MRKAAILLIALTISVKLIAFVKDIVLAFFFGATDLTDAYLISLTIPMVLLSFVGTAVTTGYIPLYNKIKIEDGDEATNDFTNTLISISFLLCTLLFIVGITFTENIVFLFASGFTEETFELAVKFTRVSLIAIYFPIIIYILKAFLQIRNKHFAPGIIGLPLNIIIIISIIVSYYTNNIYILSSGFVIATLSQLLFLIPFVKKNKYKFKFNFKIDKNIKELFIIAIPAIIGVSVNQLNVLVDRTLASQIVIGGITSLDYANKLVIFIQSIFVLSISTVVYPLLSKMMAKNDIEKVKKILSKSLTVIFILIIPITLGAMMFSTEIVDILYGRGAFDNSAVLLTSNALLFYAIGMFGYGAREILVRAFYSMQDTKTPMVNGIIALIVNIILNVIFAKHLGIGGLALATSISAILSSILLYISLQKKLGSLPIYSKDLIKIIISSIIMAISVIYIYKYLITIYSFKLMLPITILLGMIIYLLCTYILKVKIVIDVIYELKGKFTNKFLKR